MATDICFPILKYSHAVGVLSDNTIPWTHLTASDLFVTVKGVNTHVLDGQLSLRVIQGNEVKESVDIAEYIEKALEIRRRAENAGIQLQETQLPIFGITKEAILALRYQLSDGQARRLQVRFRTTSECQQIVNVFARRGMQFQEQKPRTARPGTARPGTDSSQTRPLTVQNNSSYFTSSHSAMKPSPFMQHEVLEAGSLSEHRPSPVRSPDREFAAFETTTSPVRQMAPQPFFNRDERPPTSQLCPAQSNPPYRSQHERAGIEYQTLKGVGAGQSSTSQTQSLEASYNTTQQHKFPNRDTPAPPASTLHAPYSMPSASSAITAPTLLSSDPLSSRPQTARPSTSTSTPHPETLEHEIPPRRERPFARPESRSSAASLTLTPLPKPKLARKGTLLPKRHREAAGGGGGGATKNESSASRPATASPTKRSFAVSQTDIPRPETAAPTGKQSWSVEPVPKLPMPPPPTSPISGMRELLHSRKPLEDRSPNTTTPTAPPTATKVPRLNSLADAPHEVVSPPPTSTASLGPPKLADRGDGATSSSLLHPTPLTTCVGGLSPSSPQQQQQFQLETASLEGFSGLPNTEQQQLLEDFFAANWDNPDFEALCAAVEGCWRRIAVGL